MNDTSEIITDPARPDWRALLVPDDDPFQPWGDALAPTLLIGRRGRAQLAGEVYQPRHGARIETAYEQLRDTVLFERYLRQAHGVTTVATVTHPDTTVIIFDTGDYRSHAGITGSTDLTGEHTEWQAWLDGDVYGVIIQQSTPARHCPACGHTESANWTEVDSCWGFYSRTYATDRARQMLRDATHAISLPVSGVRYDHADNRLPGNGRRFHQRIGKIRYRSGQPRLQPLRPDGDNQSGRQRV